MAFLLLFLCFSRGKRQTKRYAEVVTDGQSDLSIAGRTDGHTEIENGYNNRQREAETEGYEEKKTDIGK